MTHTATQRSPLLAAVLASLLLAGCSGGGGDDAPAATPTPTPTPPPVSQKGIEGVGIVSRFGANFDSVTVGSSTYATAGAVVRVDDQPAMVSDLNVGNVVRIEATTEDDGLTATATLIRQVNDLEGTIDAGSIDLAAGTFMVLGQTVRVVATTVFDDDIEPASLAGLADGDAVEVSVLESGDGTYTATRVDRDDDAGDFELTGTVSNLDSAAFRFNIGPLVIDFSQATLSDFPNGEIANGDRVEVEASVLSMSGELIADEISNENVEFDGDDGDFGEIEGYVTRFDSLTDFDVDGEPVTTNSETQFEDGVASALALGVRVEVEGVYDTQGVLLAESIEFEDAEDDSDIEISAQVEAIDATAGTIGVLGLTLTVPVDAVLEDGSDADLEPFGLSDISVGDYVELTVVASAASLDVLVLERDDLSTQSALRGRVDTVAEPQLTILGVNVETVPATEFEALDEEPISAAEFFEAVMPGDIVDAEGVWNGTAIVADEVEFEDD